MAKNKVILGHLSGSAVFLNPVCMIVTKMHFKEPDEGIIISKETIHTWEFVTEEAIKDAFAGKSDCALEGMTEEYGQELMGAVLKPPKASVYQLAVQFENTVCLSWMDIMLKRLSMLQLKKKQLYVSLLRAGRRRFPALKKLSQAVFR